MARSKLSTEEMVTLYVDEMWPCGSIAMRAGVTRAGVWKRLQGAGVDTSRGGSNLQLQVPCSICGKILRRNRAKVRDRAYQYCSRDCYYAMLQAGATADPRYHGGMLGKLARWKAQKLYGGPLPAGAIVHHENRDRSDNSDLNLLIFKSQGDHMRWHRGILVEPLWPNPIPGNHSAHPNTKTFKSKKQIPKAKREGRFRDACRCGWQGSYTLYMLKKYGGFSCPDCGGVLVNEF